MGDYRVPADVPISSSWQDHKDRNPPSSEPGTDYATAYGTAVACAGNGRVADLKTNNGGGTGRYLTIDLDDGRRVRYLHLSQIWRSVGDRVSKGEAIAASGASGYGDDWYYGPHVHVTLFPGYYYDFSRTMDFQLYVEDGFLMGLSDEQQNEIYIWASDTWTRIRGSDPNADILQIIDSNARDTQIRVRGSDPNVDMLQDIQARVKELESVPPPTADPLSRPLLIVLAILAAIGAAELGILVGVLSQSAGG